MTVGERIRREAREIGLVTLYFLSCFLIFLSLKKLLLAQYHLEITIFRTALIGALVVAKVVVLLEKTSFGGRFRSASLFAHVLWRSLSYTAVVFAVTLVERLFDFYRESSALPESASRFSPTTASRRSITTWAKAVSASCSSHADFRRRRVVGCGAPTRKEQR